MRRILRKRPSPAMVIAFIALMAAMAPSAAALRGINLISPNDLRIGAVDKRAIRTNAVDKLEIRRDSIGINEMREQGERDAGLDGRHIVESRLGKVPAATKADSATTAGSVDGLAVAPFTGLNGTTTGERRAIVTRGPFQLVAVCTDNGGGGFTARVLLRNNGPNGAVAEVGTTDEALNTGEEVELANASGTTADIADGSFSAVSPQDVAISGEAVAAVHTGANCGVGGSVRG